MLHKQALETYTIGYTLHSMPVAMFAGEQKLARVDGRLVVETRLYFFFFGFFFFTPPAATPEEPGTGVAARSGSARDASICNGAACGFAFRFVIFCMSERFRASNRLRKTDEDVLNLRH